MRLCIDSTRALPMLFSSSMAPFGARIEPCAPGPHRAGIQNGGVVLHERQEQHAEDPSPLVIPSEARNPRPPDSGLSFGTMRILRFAQDDNNVYHPERLFPLLFGSLFDGASGSSGMLSMLLMPLMRMTPGFWMPGRASRPRTRTVSMFRYVTTL